MRLLLDANVIFAASWSPEGRAAALVRLAEAGHATLLASPHGIEEARRNLARKRPPALRDLQAVLDVVELTGEAPTELVAQMAERHGLPPGDAPILAAALAAGVDALVTGDATHFGHLYDVAGEDPVVLRPKDALARALDEVEQRSAGGQSSMSRPSSQLT
jgi:predicted nucleic acid-binding protein